MLDKFDEMKFSQLQNIFFNSLTAIFGQDVDSEDTARFSKMLIDYIIRTVHNTTILGLDNKLMPIANFSLWQGVAEGDNAFFTFRKETMKSDKLYELQTMLQETFDKWSDTCLGGAVTFEDTGDDKEAGKWIMPEKKDD